MYNVDTSSNEIYEYKDLKDGSVECVMKDYQYKLDSDGSFYKVKRKRRNFTRKKIVFDEDKLNILYNNINNCGLEDVELVSPDGDIYVFKSYCNNRVCDHPDCKKHRMYLYMKEHKTQIDALNRNMLHPRAWVFTGWKLEFWKLEREFLRNKLKLLYAICKKYCSSEFSIHLEVKIYPTAHKDFGMCYVHFHVVAGGFRIPIKNKDGLKHRLTLEDLWKRKIRYQDAIKPVELGFYISKYACKSPYFEFDGDRERYHLLVYKLQMSRFSVRKGFVVRSGWILMKQLELEVFNAYRSDVNHEGILNVFHPFVDSYLDRKTDVKSGFG